jgi:phosphatidylinositol alpha-1,6-mannosyltransferase
MRRSKEIQVWMGDAFNFKGGIQVFNQFFLKALDSELPDYNFHIFFKKDRDADGFRASPRLKLSFFGGVPESIQTFFWIVCLICSAVLNRPRFIICGHINFSPLAVFINRFLEIPYMVIVHGVDAWRVKEKSKLNGLIQAKSIFAVSEYTRNEVIRQIGERYREKIIVFHNTFDEQRFVPKPIRADLLDRYGLQGKKIILSVGRLIKVDRYKGYDGIIRALVALRKVFPNIHYLIVGTGDDQDRLKQLASDLQVQHQVTFAGFVKDNELSDHYNLCDVFIMPSKGEGFGIVFLEAMACGKPVIAGNQDGSVDALRQGELGVLVNPDAPHEIRIALSEVLSKKFPLPLLYSPVLLSQKVSGYFGYRNFKERLKREMRLLLDGQG